eukprot:TRINITY_DN3108_c0_g2_i1.p1 TRINITY_DN3108_c0_g2~~TRINITY_DN3108_c0_g2_i1.p1  ORF type:complete len:911 (-),score=216.08 TRINITY_DN3108_c0_g2_i1:114-2846(-)
MSIPKPKATYAPTSRASCKHCGNNIAENTVRITQYERSPYHDGFIQNNHHLRCAYFLKSLDELRNWKTLRWNDQLSIYFKVNLPAPNESDPVIKQRREYVDTLWKVRSQIEKNLDKKAIKALVDANGRNADGLKPPDLLDICAEGMAFGCPEPCPYCKNKTLTWEGDVCVCYGWYSAAIRCQYESTQAPKRYRWIIPDELLKLPFLASWKAPYGDLPLDSAGAGASGTSDPSGASGASQDATPGSDAPAADPNAPSEDEKDEDVPANEELLGYSFAFLGKMPKTRADLQAMVEEHGGAFQAKVDLETTHFVTVKEEVTKRSKSEQTKAALKYKIPIVTYDFLEDLAVNRKVELRSRKHLTPYLLGTETGPKLPTVSALKHKRRRTEAKEEEAPKSPVPSLPPKPTDKVHPESRIMAVDADFGRGQILLTDNETVAWNALLSRVGLETGINNCYILQVVRQGASYYVFRKWGRMGGSADEFDRPTTKTETYRTEASACASFRELFLQHTGNNWDEAHAFVHKPGKFNLIQLGRGKLEKSDDGSTQPDFDVEPSKLPPTVKGFVDLIFDKTMMKRQLEQQNIDTKKINLESLSKDQIRAGYAILNEIQKLIEEKATPGVDAKLMDLRLKDATSRFFNTIPHSFPQDKPPKPIDNLELLREKTDLIESILSVSHASTLTSTKVKTKNPSDVNYEALKCELIPVDPSSTEFDMVKRYVANTHASTHSSYGLEVIELFRASREGEDERYKPYENLHNRRLLWHGSRLMNWVGIISQGLRIAPPEAPVSGYMFGKGVYFADMVSKSANYCFTTPSENVSVMMLCEVALGDFYERTTSEFLANESCKAKGKHSTWGIGSTQPDPKQNETIPENVTVPLGKGIHNPRAQSLLYNEFIVYDVAQIKARYVMRMKFNYRR